MDVWSLASGSSGNAYLVRTAKTVVLVECGISLSKTVRYLGQHGVEPGELAGVLLTHEHSDHIRSARQLSDAYGVPLFATGGTLGHRSLRDSSLARLVSPDRPFQLGDLEIRPFSVPHDATEPVGYRLAAPAGTVCITTDLGFVPDSVRPRFRDADLLVLEANHDEEMLHAGPYPSFLKRRVLGRHGHLSNTASAEALVACGDRVATVVWLAHLSAVNNTPTRAVMDVADRLTDAGLGHVQVEVTRRNQPSLHWSSEPRVVQMRLL
jgi:phosphoribosyl 1,2-cyclic phosphodiesterase